ncbi:MAG TPA: TIR domain-containing protein [Sphingomicrobium sp.]
MADVFISYARADEAVARRAAKSLKAAGLSTWWDADLPAHRAYSDIIERNLAEAKAVVVLWSKTAAASQWVRAEADFARNAGKLVQAQVDGALPPMPFNQIQCADLRGWRGSAKHVGWAKLQASVLALVLGEEIPRPERATPGLRARLRPYRWPIAALLALFLAAGIYLYLFGTPGEERRPVLAVLPFRSLDAQDESLVAGMWEDTRTAIGRNPQLVVLGPNTAQRLAEKGEGATRRAADYLLEASVRTAGDRVRVSADLVRTKDGEQLWSQDFDRKLDDVFALQSEIASEIEGRIRGRLAQRGGVKPEHIATSGEVYALYSDARAKIRKRDDDLIPAARAQLERVVRLDPNFAPGWATLAQVVKMSLPSQNNWDISSELPQQFARKAIDLAPNLAAGHAALALALDLSGPVALSELKRAVQLDPNDYEALNWLAGMLSASGDKKGALDAYTRAVELEPFFWPAAVNKLNILNQLGDQAALKDFIEHEKSVGADYLAAFIEMDQAQKKGQLAKAANIGLQYWSAATRPEERVPIGVGLWLALYQLGFYDEAHKIGPAPDFAPYLWRNDPKGLDMLEAEHVGARAFFELEPLTENAGRVYLLSGRGKTLADMYLSLKKTPASFAALASGDGPEHFLYIAPLVAIALRENGHPEEASALLALAEKSAEAEHSTISPQSSVLLARILAAQGRRQEAMPLLIGAVNRGWIPRPPELLVDLHDDPALAGLKGDERFEGLRERILGTIKRERAQVNLSLLRQLSAA